MQGSRKQNSNIGKTKQTRNKSKENNRYKNRNKTKLKQGNETKQR